MANGTVSGRLNDYKYADLSDPLNTRILILQAADESTTAIDCRLEEWGAEPREYEALSWCWSQGDTTKYRKLRIHENNGLVYGFAILEHLYEGLLALRYTDRPRYIWIDAVCIHQANAEERNQQVPRMRDIYGKASNVCVWLGKPSDESELQQTKLAFDFVKYKLLELWQFDSLCKKHEHGEAWLALLYIMKRQWFSRRWIVQEISLARRGTVYCGDSKMDWQEFADAVSLFVQIEETPTRLSELIKKSDKYKFEHNFFEEVPFLGATLLVKTTKDIYQRSVGGGHYKQLSLESLVSRLAIFKTAEPRDTIYGLLAMARDSEPYANYHGTLHGLTPEQGALLAKVSQYLPTPIKARYDVNYKSQVIDVYQEFIAFSIRNADPLRALDIICRPFAQNYTRRQDFSFDQGKLDDLTEEEKDRWVTLPSWVPHIADLPFDMSPAYKTGTTDPGNPFDLRMNRVNGDSFVGPPAPERKLYSATGLRPFNKNKLSFKKLGHERHGQTPYSMFVEGFVFDHIAQKEESAQGGNIPHGWLECLKWTDRQQDPPDPDRWDAFWRTLVGNRDFKGSDPPIYYQRACKEIIRKAFGDSGSTFETSKWITYTQTPTPVASFLRRVLAVIWGRCLVETKGGRLGLAKSTVRPGHHVCILYGCSVPVILQRFEKTDDELRREQAEDEAADREFERRAAEKLRRVFDRRKAARERVSPAAAATAGLQTTLWLRLGRRYRLIHVARTLVLAALAMWVGSRGETLTAVLLGYLVALCYILSFTSRGILQASLSWWWTLFDALFTFAFILATSTLLRSWGSGLVKEVRMVSILSVIMFPQFLHLPTRSLYFRVRDQVERRLDDIHSSESENIRDMQNLHWWLVEGLTARFRQLYEKPKRSLPKRERLRSKHYYRLIGECYIHDMMDGDAIGWQLANEVKPEVFEIR